MRIRTAIAGLFIGGMALTGCGMEWPDPCAGSFTPSERDLQAAADGYEVEDDSTSCELNRSGQWVYDD